MRYHVKEEDGAALTVVLEGHLTYAAGDRNHAQLADLDNPHARQVRFEMSGLSHIDSVGLGLLYIASEDLGDIGASITLVHPRDNVFRMLELTEADKAFKITR